MNHNNSLKRHNSALSRRTFLKGLGVSMALPVMESLVPAAMAKSLEQRPKRMTVFYSPNGVRMQRYTPATAGKNYAMTPILKPLEKVRDKFTVISGLAHYQASAFGAPPAGHGRSCPAFLTGGTCQGYRRCGYSMRYLCRSGSRQLLCQRHPTRLP